MERRRSYLIALWLIAVPFFYWGIVNLFGFIPFADRPDGSRMLYNLGIQSALLFVGVLVLAGRARADGLLMFSLMMASLFVPLFALMAVLLLTCLFTGSCL